jgi:hypothetical protein
MIQIKKKIFNHINIHFSRNFLNVKNKPLDKSVLLYKH